LLGLHNSNNYSIKSRKKNTYTKKLDFIKIKEIVFQFVKSDLEEIAKNKSKEGKKKQYAFFLLVTLYI